MDQVWLTMPSRTSQVRLSPRRPARVSRQSTMRSDCSLWRKRRPRNSLSTYSPRWPKGVCPRSCPRQMASARSSFSSSALAMVRATWVTSSVWVRRIRKWSPSGARKTWVLCASRRKALAWRMRSRSRWKAVRRGCGSSGICLPRDDAERTACGDSRAASATSSLSLTKASRRVSTGDKRNAWFSSRLDPPGFPLAWTPPGHPLAIRASAGVLAPCQVSGPAQREGHDREGRIDAAGRDEDRAVGEVDVVQIVDAAPGVDDRGCRVVAHPRRAHDMGGAGGPTERPGRHDLARHGPRCRLADGSELRTVEVRGGQL